MKILDLKHGTPPWKADRKNRLNASEAGMMMGVHPNVTRNELLEMKATGTEQEFTEWFEKNVLDKGHRVEEAARPHAEAIVGDELFPIIASDDDNWLGASYDGQTMDESVNWECKQWNGKKAEEVRNGKVPAADYWQVLQGLHINRGSKTLYMVTDGTPEKMECIWVELNEDDAETLQVAWRQFENDVANYVATDAPVVVQGKAPDALPALHIELTGMVKASNLPEFEAHALEVLDNINRDLQTDEDFANAAQTVKWAQDVEDRLAAAKQHALSQTASIDELFRTIDKVSEETRRVRLDLDKLVTARKKAIKQEIALASKTGLDQHIAEVNAGLKGVQLPQIPADFNTAMKGKRTVATLQSAAENEAARAKVEATKLSERIQKNLQQLDATGKDFLFSDRQQLVLKDPEDLQAFIAARLAQYEAEERQRQEEERERIRREEQAKAEAEAKRKADEEAEAQRQQQAEAERQTTQAQPQKSSGAVRPQPVQAEAKSEEPARYATTERPTDNQILAVISAEWGVSMEVAADWVLNMNPEHLEALCKAA